MEYKRLTNRKRFYEDEVIDMDEIYERLAELEDKIENKKLVFVPEYVEKYAIVKYTFWKNQPLDIATYYPCGIKMNGEIDYGFSGLKSGNITVVQDGFPTRAEAEAKHEELKNGIQENDKKESKI